MVSFRTFDVTDKKPFGSIFKTKRDYIEWVEKLNKKEVFIYVMLAAGLSLFLELSIIRIHSSYLHFFSFLKKSLDNKSTYAQ